MKKFALFFLTASLALCGSAFAQRGGGRGRGGFPPPAPALTGPVADMVNAFVKAINDQDSAYLQKTVASDAIWADEDGHFLPATLWINRLMQAKPAKKLSMSDLTGQTWDGGAWAAFRYTLDETTRAGAPNEMKGTATLAFKKTGADWQVVMVHAPVDGPAVAAH